METPKAIMLVVKVKVEEMNVMNQRQDRNYNSKSS